MQFAEVLRLASADAQCKICRFYLAQRVGFIFKRRTSATDLSLIIRITQLEMTDFVFLENENDRSSRETVNNKYHISLNTRKQVGIPLKPKIVYKTGQETTRSRLSGKDTRDNGVEKR